MNSVGPSSVMVPFYSYRSYSGMAAPCYSDTSKNQSIMGVGLSNILDNELNGGKPMEGSHMMH